MPRSIPLRALVAAGTAITFLGLCLALVAMVLNPEAATDLIQAVWGDAESTAMQTTPAEGPLPPYDVPEGDMVGVQAGGSPRLGEEPPVLLGIYPWGSFRDSIVQIQAMDAWAGVGNSIAATFMDLYDPLSGAVMAEELNAAWSAGYTPFINLAPSPGASGEDCPAELAAKAIAGGSLDTEIRQWASALRDWTEGDPTRRAFLAPLQEMNGYWICYGLDPASYRRAFVHVQRVFQQAGVPANRVSWVFAPNGWSSDDAPTFEAYYPGNAFVDVVAFSAYNFAACSPYPADDWRTPQQIFEGYLARMRDMAPGKPIFVAETATTSMRQDGLPGGKDGWLEASYTYFDTYPAVRGVLYFNVDEHPTHENVPDCDFPIFKPPEVMGYEGYRRVVNDPGRGYAYVPPSEIGPLAFERPDGVYEDVWPAHPFAGVPEPDWRRPWIEMLGRAGIIDACRQEELLSQEGELAPVILEYFCPQQAITRSQIARFLGRALEHRGVDLAPSSEGAFSDMLDSDPTQGWAEPLLGAGVMPQCAADPTQYCPGQPVERAEMAQIIGRAQALVGELESQDLAGEELLDVPGDYPGAEWIRHALASGIMGLCAAGPPRFCPEGLVTRADAVVIIGRALGFSLP